MCVCDKSQASKQSSVDNPWTVGKELYFTSGPSPHLYKHTLGRSWILSPEDNFLKSPLVAFSCKKKKKALIQNLPLNRKRMRDWNIKSMMPFWLHLPDSVQDDLLLHGVFMGFLDIPSCSSFSIAPFPVWFLW